eukprot:SAG25_NODE_3458_length_1077_cov_1.274029_1_plen_81_part_00
MRVPLIVLLKKLFEVIATDAEAPWKSAELSTWPKLLLSPLAIAGGSKEEEVAHVCMYVCMYVLYVPSMYVCVADAITLPQ